MKALVCVLALVPLLTNCVLAPCGLVACRDGVTVTVEAVPDLTPFLGANVQMCRDDVCLDLVMPTELPPPPSSGLIATTDARDWLYLEVSFIANMQQAFTLDLYFRDDPARLADGDEYSIEILSTDGERLFEYRWTADFQRVYPNGERCDDGCKTQSIPLVFM